MRYNVNPMQQIWNGIPLEKCIASTIHLVRYCVQDDLFVRFMKQMNCTSKTQKTISCTAECHLTPTDVTVPGQVWGQAEDEGVLGEAGGIPACVDRSAPPVLRPGWSIAPRADPWTVEGWQLVAYTGWEKEIFCCENFHQINQWA